MTRDDAVLLLLKALYSFLVSVASITDLHSLVSITRYILIVVWAVVANKHTTLTAMMLPSNQVEVAFAQCALLWHVIWYPHSRPVCVSLFTCPHIVFLVGNPRVSRLAVYVCSYFLLFSLRKLVRGLSLGKQFWFLICTWESSLLFCHTCSSLLVGYCALGVCLTRFLLSVLGLSLSWHDGWDRLSSLSFRRELTIVLICLMECTMTSLNPLASWFESFHLHIYLLIH